MPPPFFGGLGRRPAGGDRIHRLQRVGSSLIATLALLASLSPGARIAGAQEVPATITIGINLPFTGADAADAAIIRDGALMAIDEINAQGGIMGRIMIQPQIKDDGTVAAGQYD